MTDDISKVVEARQIIDEFIQCANVGRSDGKLVSAAKDWLAATDRIESATTPEAINPASVDNQFTYSPIEPPYRLTPAITTSGHAGVALDPEGSYTYYDDYATLARQLAEAKAELSELRRVGLEYRTRAEQAESQLTEATRRLGEVEGLLQEWLNADHAGWIDPLIDRTEAALKEPK